MTDQVKLDLGEYLPYLVNRVGTIIADQFGEETLAPYRLSIAMWRVMAVLASNGGRRQIDVADLTSIDASTLSRLVTRLVRVGLVTRARSASSDREVVVNLTAKGRTIVGRLVPIAREYEKVATAGLSPSEISVLKRCLRRVYGKCETGRHRRPSADFGVIGGRPCFRNGSRRLGPRTPESAPPGRAPPTAYSPHGAADLPERAARRLEAQARNDRTAQTSLLDFAGAPSGLKLHDENSERVTGETRWGRSSTRMRSPEVYARWAPIYDLVFGSVFERGRKAAIAAAERIGGRILEVGVGTGISLPDYRWSSRLIGVDLSVPMLRKAKQRVREHRLTNVDGLAVMDAQHLGFQDAAFDVVVAQYVITAVPDPEATLDEFARVTRPGGEIILINHLGAEEGLRAILERWFAPLARRLGWQPEFRWERIAQWAGQHGGVHVIERRAMPPLGHFSLIRFARLGAENAGFAASRAMQ